MLKSCFIGGLLNEVIPTFMQWEGLLQPDFSDPET